MTTINQGMSKIKITIADPTCDKVIKKVFLKVDLWIDEKMISEMRKENLKFGES